MVHSARTVRGSRSPWSCRWPGRGTLRWGPLSRLRATRCRAEKECCSSRSRLGSSGPGGLGDGARRAARRLLKSVTRRKRTMEGRYRSHQGHRSSRSRPSRSLQPRTTRRRSELFAADGAALSPAVLRGRPRSSTAPVSWCLDDRSGSDVLVAWRHPTPVCRDHIPSSHSTNRGRRAYGSCDHLVEPAQSLDRPAGDARR